MEKARRQRAKNKLLPVAAILFLLFWAAKSGVMFSVTDPARAMEVETAPSVSQYDSGLADIQRNFKLLDMKDPFRSFILERKATGGEKEGLPRTYLETVDLSQLQLIAVVTSPEDGWAMLRDSKGIGYVVRPGTPVGTDGGKVYQIRPGEIILRSVYTNAGGGVMVRETAKRLEQ